MKLNSDYGDNYFYLGVIKEVMDADYAAAKRYYKQGCDRHSAKACDYLAKFQERVGAYPKKTQPAAAAPAQPEAPETTKAVETTKAAEAAGSAGDEALYAKLAAAYKKKGADEATISNVLENIRNSFKTLTPTQRTAQLNHILDGIK
jgi:hypothetical protein